MRGTDRCHRRTQLVPAVLAERVLVVGVEVGQLRRDDLALLPQGAGEDVHLVTEGDVVGDGHAGGEGLVVGVRVDEEQAGTHRSTPMIPISGTPPCTGLPTREVTSEPAA